MSVGVELAGVHQPDGVAGVVYVEVEGDAPHDDQPERQLQDLKNQTMRMSSSERGRPVRTLCHSCLVRLSSENYNQTTTKLSDTTGGWWVSISIISEEGMIGKY